MIYLNNAATSYPKPQAVIESVANCLAGPPAGQFRGAAGGESGDVPDRCRQNIARLLGVSDAAKIFFTSGATEAANAVVGGIAWRCGTAVVTSTEHNSVLRPLYNHRPPHDVRVAACDRRGYVSADSIKEAAAGGCDAVFVNHCSNVTGAVQNLPSLGQAAKEAGALFVVDASQSAGCMPVNADACGADIVIFTGHKSLLGPQGTGGFFARQPETLRPLLFGGTGADSAKLAYDLDGDQEFEPGTRNIPGLAGLLAATDYLLQVGLPAIESQESELTGHLIDSLARIEGVSVYCGCEGRRGPLASFAVAGLAPGDIAYMLAEIYGIAVRSGLQCAPLIHKDIGTGEKGVVRASLSCFSSHSDIDALADAVREICRGVQAKGEPL